MLLIIGWRGEPGVHDEPQHVKQGKVTISLLQTMGIEHLVLESEYQQQIKYAVEYMDKYQKPFALVIRKGIFSEYKIKKEQSEYTLTREDALKEILSDIFTEDVVVSTTGKTSREIFEIRESRGQDHSSDFLTVGSMGHTASIAYGVCVGTDKNVWCIDGDGSFIMHMGSLAVIGSAIPNNFKYILNDNNAHESVGGQPTCSKLIDLPNILKACGFKNVIVATTTDEIKEGIAKMNNESGIAMIIHTRQGARENLGRPTTTPQENKKALMHKLGVI
jgi:phosphonopyruvate decarboxylase